MSKAGKRNESRRAKEKAADAPSPYLPTADPPRKNATLLLVCSALLALWMIVLLYLALAG